MSALLTSYKYGKPILPAALAFTVAADALLAGCAPSADAVIAQTSPAARPDHASEAVMSPDLADRFPGATILDEADLARAIVGRRFRYRELGSEILVEQPKEIFAEQGQYRLHGLRTISYGTYAIGHGIVSIACADCRYPFLNLGWERLFFRHEGKLLMTSAQGGGSVVELISEP